MSKQTPDKIRVNGHVYVRQDKAELRVAQLQELLAVYEKINEPLIKAVGNLNPEGLQKILTGAHQSILGKKAQPAAAALTQAKSGLDAVSKQIGELIETANTIAGHLGMGGN